VLHQVVEGHPQNAGAAPVTSTASVSLDSAACVAAVGAGSVPQHGAKKSQNWYLHIHSWNCYDSVQRRDPSN